MLTGAMRAAAATAVREGSAIGLVDVDGQPHLVQAGDFSDPGVNSVALQAAQQHFLGSLISAAEHVRAAFPHADVLDALNVAGHAIRAACRHGGTIYLEDSGLQESGVVNFRQAGLLGAAPASIVRSLTQKRELPYLAGITVVLVGIGYTAPPQQPLSISQQDNLVAIWAAIAKAGGATVQIDLAPLSGPAPAHVPAVSLVRVPPISSVHGADGSIITTLPDTLLFHFNSAALLPSADAVLRPLAEQARSQHLQVSVTGYASPEGSSAYNKVLSERRAIAVRDQLIALSLPPAQAIHVSGAGIRQPQNGCLIDGHLNEARCALLRRVVVIFYPRRS
jgi:outer membrane protein OmpA-like peptidoglycan-associated protein